MDPTRMNQLEFSVDATHIIVYEHVCSTTTYKNDTKKKQLTVFSKSSAHPIRAPFVESTPLLAPSAPLKDKISLAFPRSTAHLSFHPCQVVGLTQSPQSVAEFHEQ